MGFFPQRHIVGYSVTFEKFNLLRVAGWIVCCLSIIIIAGSRLSNTRHAHCQESKSDVSAGLQSPPLTPAIPFIHESVSVRVTVPGRKGWSRPRRPPPSRGRSFHGHPSF